MTEIDHLVSLLARLPGLGPRSARRAVLFLLKNRETLLDTLARSLVQVQSVIRTCSICGNLDTHEPCFICRDDRRDRSTVCVVEEVDDLWALERSDAFNGTYHVLGGTLSALDGVTPEDLRIAELVARASADDVSEVILATGATVDGQTTAHYIVDRLASCQVTISRLAHGVPVGGELSFLDDGTLITAFRARSDMKMISRKRD